MEIKNVPSSLTPTKLFLMSTTSASALTLSPTLSQSLKYQVRMFYLNLPGNGAGPGTPTTTIQIFALSTSYLTDLGATSLASKPICINSQLFLQLLSVTKEELKRRILKKLAI